MKFLFRKKSVGVSEQNKPGSLVWKRFRKNYPAMAGLIFILVLILIAILGYTITPDSTPSANRQMIQAALRPPGFSLQMISVPSQEKYNSGFFHKMLFGAEATDEWIPAANYSFFEDSVRVSVYAGEGLPPVIQNYSLRKITGKNSPAEMQSEFKINHMRNFTFAFGTDKLGRDVLSRILIGTRISLTVGFIAVIISLLIGVTLGSSAGFFGGKTDAVIVWLINVVWAIPTLLLVFAITLALGKGFWQIFIAVGLTMWVDVARMIRGQVLLVRQLDYVEAARSLGFHPIRILFVHILPNVIGPVMVVAASNFATAILMESGLSFLGIGVQYPTPSFGSMLRDNYAFIITGNPMIALIPGIAIMLLVLSFNLLGNGLRDAFDVKIRSIHS